MRGNLTHRKMNYPCALRTYSEMLTPPWRREMHRERGSAPRGDESCLSERRWWNPYKHADARPGSDADSPCDLGLLECISWGVLQSNRRLPLRMRPFKP